MSSRELGPEWVLSAFLQNAEARGQDDVSELAIVACRLWPRIQAHARKELTNKMSDDTMVLATGVWESVLLSVAKTMRRSNGKGRPILNLEAYLFGAFHHRFNRALRRERKRREMVEYLPLGRDLERLRHAHDSKAAADLDRSIQVKKTIESMDTGHAHLDSKLAVIPKIANISLPGLIGEERVSNYQIVLSSIMGDTSKMNGPLHMRERRASLFDEDTSSVSEFDNPFLVASEQTKSKLFFDLSDLLAERRLADAQSLRSVREVEFLGQNNDCAQVTHFNIGEHCSKPLSPSGRNR